MIKESFILGQMDLLIYKNFVIIKIASKTESKLVSFKIITITARNHFIPYNVSKEIIIYIIYLIIISLFRSYKLINYHFLYKQHLAKLTCKFSDSFHCVLNVKIHILKDLRVSL